MIYIPKFENPFTGKPKDENPSPYLSARREWNEVYGQLVASARHSRIRERILWAYSALISTALIFAALNPKFVPYIIEVNSKGAVLGAGIPSHKSIDERTIVRELSDWISFHRAVVRDPLVQKQYINRIYAYLVQSDPGAATVADWYQANDPFKRAETELVSVEVESVLRQSDGTFQIEWKESPAMPSGKSLPESRYRGLLTVETHEIKDGEAIPKNPLGIFIKDISIAKIGG